MTWYVLGLVGAILLIGVYAVVRLRRTENRAPEPAPGPEAG